MTASNGSPTASDLLQAAMPALKLPWLLAFGASDDADHFEMQATLPPIEVAAEYRAEVIRTARDAENAWQTLLLMTYAKSADCQLRLMRQVLKVLHARPKPAPDSADYYLLQLITHYFGFSSGITGAILWILDQAAAETPSSAGGHREPEIKTDPDAPTGEATPTVEASESTTVTSAQSSPSAPEPQATAL